MRVHLASVPGRDDRPNEDFIAASPDAVVLLDGAGTLAGRKTGCRHGVAWFARTLGMTLLATITDDNLTLSTGLRSAIEHVRSLHETNCDLDHADTPSATVVATRIHGPDLEYLVLADSTLVLDQIGTAPRVVTDDRLADVGRSLRTQMDALPTGSPEHTAAFHEYVDALAAHRNSPAGFWVAGTNPDAADHALTGSLPLDRLNAFALLSDGTTRLVDRFHLADWAQTLDMLAGPGPHELIRRVRDAEHSDPDGKRWPRGKSCDDATAAYCRL